MLIALFARLLTVPILASAPFALLPGVDIAPRYSTVLALAIGGYVGLAVGAYFAVTFAPPQRLLPVWLRSDPIEKTSQVHDWFDYVMLGVGVIVMGAATVAMIGAFVLAISSLAAGS